MADNRFTSAGKFSPPGPRKPDALSRMFGPMHPLDKAAMATAPIPVAGDILGLLADARMFAQEPESRTVTNGLLAGAGLMPFVPSLGGMVKAYHGAQSPINWPLRASHSGEIGPGVYITKEAEQANEYARPAYGAMYPEGANVIPINIDGELKHIDREWWVNKRSEIMDRLRKENNGEWKGSFKDDAEREIMKMVEDEGYVGMYLNNPTGEASFMYDQGVVFDPKSIR